MAEGGYSPPDEQKLLQQCGICLSEFQDPKLLNCFHTFCFKCLDEYVKIQNSGSTFPCPLCRADIYVPSNGVAGFQTNFYIQARRVTDSPISHVCQICRDGKTVAATKCLECDEYMCNACTTCHRRMKVSRGHQFIDIADMDGTELKRLLIQKKIYCSKHTEEEVRFLCEKCDILVCLVCKLGAHEGHPSADIADVADTKRGYLHRVAVKLKNHIVDICKYISLTEAEMDKVSGDGITEKEHVRKYVIGLKDMIEKEGQEQIRQIDDHGTIETKCLKKQKNILVSHQASLELALTTIEDILSVGSNHQIVDITQWVDALQDSLKLHQSRKVVVKSSTITFSHGNADVSSLHRTCTVSARQSVDDLKLELNSKPEIKVCFQREFTCEEVPCSIVPEKDGEAWVVEGAGILRRKDFHGETIHSITKPKKMNFVDCVCASEDGSLLVSLYQNNTIVRVGTNRKSVKTFKQMSHMVRGLCVTERGIVVSGVDADDKQFLSLLNKSGDVIRTVSRPEWEHIDRLDVHHVSGNLCVCDRGRSLLILSPTLDYKDRYEGQDDLDHVFEPTSICVDSCGHILVADLMNNCVHMLSGHGRFIRYLLTGEDGVERPWAIAVDMSDQVWVGCEYLKCEDDEKGSGKVLIFKYLV